MGPQLIPLRKLHRLLYPDRPSILPPKRGQITSV